MRGQSDQFDLFAAAPVVDDYTLQMAADGLSHYRDLVRRYSKCWPDQLPHWRACITHFEVMRDHGYLAASRIPSHPDYPYYPYEQGTTA